jgi:flagellar hook-basal body complex protein FliE
MRIVPLEPDAPLAPLAPREPGGASVSSGPVPFAAELGRAFDAASGALGRAERAESAFLRGRGGLAEMIVERARADALLSLAAAAGSRAAQSLSTILGMQV